MRVLHLFEASDFSVPHARLALLAQSLGRMPDVTEDVCLLGNRSLETAANDLGITARWRFNLAGRMGISGYFRLRRELRQHRYDLIHCWSIRTMGSPTLAAVTAADVPRVVTVCRMASAKEARWAGVLTRHLKADTVYLPISSSVGRSMLEHGVDPQHVHTLRPGIDMSLYQPSLRKPLRESWEVDNATRVVALLGDPTEEASAMAAFMATGLADQILASRGRPVVLLVHPQQRDIDQAMSTARQIDPASRIVLEPRIDRPWEILPGCDIALAMGHSGGNLPLLWAMACAVPIVAEATPAISEIVEDRHSAMLARPDLPKALAHRITQLAEDEQLAWKLKDTARHEAYTFFSRQRYVQSLKQVYEQVTAREPVAIEAAQANAPKHFAAHA